MNDMGTLRNEKGQFIKGSIMPENWLALRKIYMSGSNNYNWKGGKTKTSMGYIRIWDKSKSNLRENRTFEHRLIMEKMIGRKLEKGELVHHLNGIKDDNRPENLCLTSPQKHDTYSYVKQLQERVKCLEAKLTGDWSAC